MGEVCHARKLHMLRAIASILAFILMSHAAMAQPVQLYSAGSLKGAWLETIAAFAAATGIKVEPKFGPSGTLKDAIVGGARADVFTSANMEHPQALTAAHLSGPTVLFARNRLCAIVRPGVDVTSATLLDRMLDPAVKLATSTPKADPAGDYAWQVFHKAEAVKPGAFAQLDKKALQLVGNPNAPPPPADGRIAYGALLAEGKADVFLAYCTAAKTALQENPNQREVALPPELAVGADYGLTVLKDAPPDAYKFAMFILSRDAQSILAKAGFDAPALPQN
jgi:molybdate transport system substrate-binding protein